jgi:hypothetical protein
VRLGLAVDATGVINAIMNDGSQSMLTLDSLASDQDPRPSRCDLDGDGDEDLVLGFGSGSAGQIALLHLEDGAVVSVDSIEAGIPSYRMADGQTYPACGDLDGDGRSEIVVGFGGSAREIVQIFDDNESRYAPFPLEGSTRGALRVPVSDEAAVQETTLMPAVGDIDGDGRDELVIGLGMVGAHEIVILDDAVSGFGIHPASSGDQAWIRIPGSGTAREQGGATYPSVGDFDGDGLDEVAIGFGEGSGGWLAVLDDAENGIPADGNQLLKIRVGREDYSSSRSSTTSPHRA